MHGAFHQSSSFCENELRFLLFIFASFSDVKSLDCVSEALVDFVQRVRQRTQVDFLVSVHFLVEVVSRVGNWKMRSA